MSIQAIDRAVAILSLFSHARPELRLTDIALEIKLPISTVNGIVRTLETAGFLSQDPETRTYRLGLRLFELGSIQMATMELNQKAAGTAHYLALETGLLTRLGVLDREAVMVTMNVHPLSAGLPVTNFGPRVPAYCGALGRAILACLDEEAVRSYLDSVEIIRYTPHTITDRAQLLEELAATRERGYSLGRQEIVLIQAGIAAPIFNRRGQPAGAISLSGDPERILRRDTDKLARLVMHAAAQISGFMGYYPSPLTARATA